MLSQFLFCLVVSLVSTFGISSSSAQDIVDTGYAKYLGNRTFPNTVAYLGIPYAEPPLGDRRFRAPLQLDTDRIKRSSNGKAIDATSYPNFCIQGSTGGASLANLPIPFSLSSQVILLANWGTGGDAGGAGSEDCLKVNIYAPVGAKKDSKLPVLVYIHGGGYVFGNPANWPFAHWVRQSPNVVIVSVYYRLDAFGFLSTPAFRDKDNGDLNAGFLDQIQALKWVQQHIDAFGGDPKRVTINGESAGGSSVELHLVAKEDGNLFSAAIAQSVYRTPLPTPEQQTQLFQFFTNQAGCGNAGATSAQLKCLRGASVSALARAQDAAASQAFGYKVFHPVVDGKILEDHPTRLIESGKFADVPLIVGATSNETLSGGTNLTASMMQFFPSLTSKGLADIEAQYPAANFASDAQRSQVITGESELICARFILGNAFSQRNSVFTYRYNQRNPTSGGTGVGHASENWMMFLGTNTGVNGTTTFSPMNPIEQAFAEELIAYWLSFVRSENPNTYKLARSPEWGPYGRNKARIVLQQSTTTVDVSGSVLEVETGEERKRCSVVASKVAEEQN